MSKEAPARRARTYSEASASMLKSFTGQHHGQAKKEVRKSITEGDEFRFKQSRLPALPAPTSNRLRPSLTSQPLPRDCSPDRISTASSESDDGDDLDVFLASNLPDSGNDLSEGFPSLVGPLRSSSQPESAPLTPLGANLCPFCFSDGGNPVKHSHADTKGKADLDEDEGDQERRHYEEVLKKAKKIWPTASSHQHLDLRLTPGWTFSYFPSMHPL